MMEKSFSTSTLQNLFSSSLTTSPKARSVVPDKPLVNLVVHPSWVGSWPYRQILDLEGKACQGHILLLMVSDDGKSFKKLMFQ